MGILVPAPICRNGHLIEILAAVQHGLGKWEQRSEHEIVIALGALPEHAVIVDIVRDEMAQSVGTVDGPVHKFLVLHDQTDEPDGGDVPSLEVVATEMQVLDPLVAIEILDLEASHGTTQQIALYALGLLLCEHAIPCYQVVSLRDRDHPGRFVE